MIDGSFFLDKQKCGKLLKNAQVILLRDRKWKNKIGGEMCLKDFQ